MRSDPSYPDLAGPQFPVVGGSSHRLGNLRNAWHNLLLGTKDSKLRRFCHDRTRFCYDVCVKFWRHPCYVT